MADIVPLPARANGYNPTYQTVLPDLPSAAPLASVQQVKLAGLRQLTFYFSDADDTELFRPPPGTLAVAFQPIAITGKLTATIGASGIVFTGAANTAGWLHCLARGSAATGTTTTDAPIGIGTAGYVEPRRGIFLNDKSVTPNTLTNASAQRRIKNKLGMRLRVFPFTPTNASDRWTNESTRACPGIVAVAWQSNNAADDVAVTLDAAGDTIFTSTAGAVDVGWLWAWSR